MSPPLVFLTATEPSGDLMGARLMAALRQATGDHVRFAGVGGPRMAAEGLDSLFPLADIAVIGAVEILPQVPRLLRRIRRTAEAALSLQPDVLIGIDGLSFNMRVAARLRERRFPIMHFVAPKVWAWRPGRAKRMARLVDRLMVQLPFEPPFFEREGLPTSYVGHPIIETGADAGDAKRFRERYGVVSGAPLLTVLPGSRKGEVTRLLPVFGEVVRRIAESRPDLRIAVPTVHTVAALVWPGVEDWPGRPIVVEGDEAKYDAFAASAAALAASGTVAVELALARLPGIIAYRVNPLSAFVVRRMLTTPYVNLVNIILDRPAVPEFLQERCTPELITPALEALFDDPAAAMAQRLAGIEVARRLGVDGPSPSATAAKVVLETIAEGRLSRPA